MVDQAILKSFDGYRLLRKSAVWLVKTLVLLLSISAVPLVCLLSSHPEKLAIAWYASAASAFGDLVGFSEITTRYRDEPLRATFNRFGISYLLVNGILSGCAFGLMRAYGKRFFPARLTLLFFPRSCRALERWPCCDRSCSCFVPTTARRFRLVPIS